jgi:hypothetical protein
MPFRGEGKNKEKKSKSKQSTNLDLLSMVEETEMSYGSAKPAMSMMAMGAP